jgi:hypothetical protein
LGFAQAISAGYSPVLGESTAGTPAAVWNSLRHGRVECAAVNARLSTRDYLHL